MSLKEEMNEQFANNEVAVIRTIDYRFLKHEVRIDSTFFSRISRRNP